MSRQCEHEDWSRMPPEWVRCEAQATETVFDGRKNLLVCAEDAVYYDRGGPTEHDISGGAASYNHPADRIWVP